MCKRISWLEVSQNADQLVIRIRRKAILLWVIAVLLGVPFTLEIAYQNIVATWQVAAFRDRSANDQTAAVLIFLFLVLPWAIVPVVGCVVCLRKYQRPWVFSHHHMLLTRVERHWSLLNLTDIAVDVLRKSRSGNAGVVLNFRGGGTLEIARFHAGRSTSLAKQIVLAEALAGIVGDFLQVPVRHPLAKDRGFEVVRPVHS